MFSSMSSLSLQGGLYVFLLFDYYACSGISIICLLILQVVTVAWLFGELRELELLWPKEVFQSNESNNRETNPEISQWQHEHTLKPFAFYSHEMIRR